MRRAEGAFVVDGPVLVTGALDAGVALEAVFVESSAEAHAGARDGTSALVARAETAGISVWALPVGSLSRLTDVVQSPGVAAIARWAPGVLAPPVTSTSCVLVLAGVADPGNAGTLLRCAEAAGFATVVFCDGAVDPTNPKCVRASAGALFHASVVVRGAAAEVLEEIGALGYRRIATQLGSDRSYDEVDLTGPIALVLGNEAHGLPAEVVGAIDEVVTIPMVGRSESLNVAMAGSIICFEALRQRRELERRQLERRQQ